MLSRSRRAMNLPRARPVGCAELYSSLPLSPLLVSAGLLKYLKVGLSIGWKDSRNEKVPRVPIDLRPLGPSAAPAWTWWPGTSWPGSWPGSFRGAEGTALLYLARRCTGSIFDLQRQYGIIRKGNRYKQYIRMNHSVEWRIMLLD